MSKRTAPRIIGGELKGLRLKSPPGTITRPITDRVKENLFNILGFNISNSRFLDLFAGTGSVGLEAYSRGAGFVQFVEKNQLPYTVLKQNLLLIKNPDAFSAIKQDAYHFISHYAGKPFDFIFIAPPQYKNMWKDTLFKIESRKDLLKPFGKLIVQIDPIEYEDLDLIQFELDDNRRYGSTLLLFYQIKSL